MDNNSITGKLLAAMVALPIIILAGTRGESAQTTATVYVWSVVTEPVQSVQRRFDSVFLLGTAGRWNAGDDQGTSGPNPLRGMEAASEYVPDYVNSDPDGVQSVQTLDFETVVVSSSVVSSSNDVPCCGGGSDIVMLKDSGAVSGEWFQSNSRAGSK